MQVPQTTTYQEVQALRNWRREETKGTDDPILKAIGLELYLSVDPIKRFK